MLADILRKYKFEIDMCFEFHNLWHIENTLRNFLFMYSIPSAISLKIILFYFHIFYCLISVIDRSTNDIESYLGNDNHFLKQAVIRKLIWALKLIFLFKLLIEAYMSNSYLTIKATHVSLTANLIDVYMMLSHNFFHLFLKPLLDGCIFLEFPLSNTQKDFSRGETEKQKIFSFCVPNTQGKI